MAANERVEEMFVMDLSMYYLSAVAGIFARGLVFFDFLQNGAQISLPVRHTRKKDSLVTFTTIATQLQTTL